MTKPFMELKAVDDFGVDDIAYRQLNPPAFIDDGYNEIGYIAAAPRLHPACRFTYRPVMLDQRAAIRMAASGKPLIHQEVITARALAKYLVDWDLKDHSGTKVAIAAENIQRMKYVLFDKMSAIVLWGNVASDDDPSASMKERGAADDLLVLSEIQQKQISDLQQELDEKN